MKHIHIVKPYKSIAMARMSAPFKTPDGFPLFYRVTESEIPDPTADLNYCLPWHTASNDELDFGDSKVVIAYTHCNPTDVQALGKACERADAIVAMSFKGRSELVNLAADTKKIWVIYSGSDCFAMPQKNIGVIGYEQPNGRKRMHLLVDLCWLMDADTKQGVNFAIAGQGWEKTVETMKLTGASVQYFDHLPDDHLQQFYSQLDALIVTGFVEGGPLPLLEAMGSGLDVFAPPIGYAADLLDDDHIYNSDIELVEILRKFVQPSINRHRLARFYTWQGYGLEHGLLFGKLLNDTVDILPRWGMSRYAQLLDIIDEIHPKSICEIGTWEGSRAIEMIQTAAKYRAIERIQYTGFDLFDDMTGEQIRREYSKQAYPIDLVNKRIQATGAKVKLVKGDTLDTLQLNIPLSADLYYIDGGHSEETIKNDWYWVQRAMDGHSVVVFDDYYHEGNGKGCNSVIDALGDDWTVEHLPALTRTEDGLLGMVKVKYAGISVSLQERSLCVGYPEDARTSTWNLQDMPCTRLANTAGSDGQLERNATQQG